jgi:hypothetical protein
LGLRHDGKKEIIDFRLAASESAAESEVRSRCTVSIGSNQLSKSCAAVSISDCGRQGVVHGSSGVISAGAQMPESLVASTWRLRRLHFSNHFCYGTPYLTGPIPIY